MTPSIANSEAAIFGRLIDAESDKLTPELARHILTIDFPKQDRTRMHELVVKNQDGNLTAEEQAELENYNHVGDLLSLWHSKARRALNQSGTAS